MNFKPSQEKKVEIPMAVVGCDFRIASSTIRQQLFSSLEDRLSLHQSIKKLDSSAGLMVLETCNRIEWIVSSETPEWIAEILVALMLNRWKATSPDMKDLPSPYIYIQEDAVVHILKVVLGMESLATGEAQIAGQFQASLNRAIKEKTSSPVLNRAGHIAGRIAKSGYKIGFRSNYRQGIHGFVVKFIKNYFKKAWSKKTILVAGMGAIGRKTSDLLEEVLSCKIICLNRTIKPEHQKNWKKLTELSSFTTKADALIVATGDPAAIIGKEHLNIKNRKKPLLIMDIGIPLQVQSSVQQLPGIHYKNIDHLLELKDHSNKDQYEQSLQNEIKKELNRFKKFCRGREMGLLLEKIHKSRLEFTQNAIPNFVSSNLQDLDETRRKQIEDVMKQLIQNYSNGIFTAFHQTLEKVWNNHEI